MARSKSSTLANQGDRIIAKNRRASHEYELFDRYEAGVSLLGSEVRSLRTHSADLRDAWVDIDSRGEAWVKGMHIPKLQHAAFGHEETRKRKLLLHQQELQRMREATEREGMTLIATQCHFKNNRVKLHVYLARGKKHHDKRETLKAKTAEREAKQAIHKGKTWGASN